MSDYTKDLRREIPPSTCQNRNQYLIVSSDLAEVLGDLIESIFALRVELLRVIESNDGNRTAVFKKNGVGHVE